MAIFKVFSPKTGLIFAVNGASAPLPPPRGPSPPPPLFSWGGRGGYTENPTGGGVFQKRGGGARGCARGIWGGGGGAEAPFTVKMSPLFGENAFLSFFHRAFLFLEAVLQ